jgi:hypothetical protein
MRRTIVSLVLVLAGATAGPALAQPTQGTFGLNAFVAPTTGFGFSYYITDRLSFRFWVGFGYSDYSGFYANVGAQLSYEFRTQGRLSPYLSATAQYSHYGNSGFTQGTTAGPTAYQQAVLDSNVGQLGAGAGLRCRVSRSLSLFAEGRVRAATSPRGVARGSRSTSTTTPTWTPSGLSYASSPGSSPRLSRPAFHDRAGMPPGRARTDGARPGEAIRPWLSASGRRGRGGGDVAQRLPARRP